MNPASPRIQQFDCSGIRCTEKSLSEVEGSRVMVTVDRNAIQRITLRHGIQAPNPTIQVIFGLAMASLGYFPVREFIDWTQHGGTFLTATHLLIVAAVLGVWTIWEAAKRGHYLEIQTHAGSKRLAFAKSPEPAALNELIASIEQNYGMAVLREDGFFNGEQ